MLSLPVVYYFHCAILLDPQFAQDDIMHTAVRVTPRVRLVVPGGEKKKVALKTDNREETRSKKKELIWDLTTCTVSQPLFWTHLSSSSVIVPLGSASTLLPQNLSLG